MIYTIRNCGFEAYTQCFGGYIRATYADLEEIFGKPHYKEDPKISCGWYMFLEELNIAFDVFDCTENEHAVDNKDKIYDFKIATRNKDNTEQLIDSLNEMGFDAFIFE